MTDHRTRRTLLASVASALAGGAVVGAASDRASAAVTLDQLAVPDQDVNVRGDVTAVPIACRAGYRWDVPNYAGTPGRWQLRLAVGETTVATESGRAGGQTDSGVATLTGDVLAADGFSAGQFQPDGAPVEVSVPVTLELVVLAGRETVATASQSAVGSVTVSAAGYDASLHGRVGGRVEIGVEGAE